MDLYELLMANEPDAAARSRALQQAMGLRDQAGMLAQLSGDRVLAPVGQALAGQAQAGREGLGNVLRLRSGAAAAKAKAEADAAQNATENSFRERGLALQGAEIGLRRQQMDQDLWSAQADPVSGGVVMYNKKTGEVRPLGPGGGTPRPQPSADGGPLPGLPGKPSEDQRKKVLGASSSIAQLDRALRALDTAPTAYGGAGNVAAGIAEGVGGETAQSLLRRRYTSEEQSARNIVENVVSGIINERAGASVSLQEMLRQSFLPKPTDTPEQVRQKLLDLKQLYAIDYEAQGNGLLPDLAGAPAGPAPMRKVIGGKTYEKEGDQWFEVTDGS